jgi:hypothetical protein
VNGERRTHSITIDASTNPAVDTVRELRNRYTQLLEWIDAGEEIRITRRGIVIARFRSPANNLDACRTS